MRFVDSIERYGAIHWRDRYPDRATYGDDVANQYGVVRIWRRITFWVYVVSFALLLLPVGPALHYGGRLLLVFGVAPLVCWLIERMKFRKAVKLVAG
jgi:lipopolysaccharide export LptBFGC system permease protein LptF